MGLRGQDGYLPSPQGGGMALRNQATNVPTTFSAVGEFVGVGNGNPGTHPLYTRDPESGPLFGIAGVSSAVQVVTYEGPPTNSFAVGTLALTTGVVGGIEFVTRLTQNGVEVANSVFDARTAGLLFSSASISSGGPIPIATGDTFALELANLTDTSDVIVLSARVTVGGLT